MSDDVKVNIGLPLPMDVAATLINLVGAAYPNAQINMSDSADRAGCEVISLKIPGDDRYASVPDRERIEAAKQVIEDETEPMLARMRDQIEVLTPEALKYHLGYIASRFFVDNPDAVNYLEVEMDVQDKDTTEQFVVTVQRKRGRSPHELRRDAEAEVERLTARITELEAA